MRLPAAEKSAKDGVKTAVCAAFRQRFSSAPGCKHANQNQQEEEFERRQETVLVHSLVECLPAYHRRYRMQCPESTVARNSCRIAAAADYP